MIRIKSDINETNFEEISEIKKYFARIFTVLSKEVRDRLKDLDISKEKMKILKKELAFLSKKNQIKYLDEIYRLYK